MRKLISLIALTLAACGGGGGGGVTPNPTPASKCSLLSYNTAYPSYYNGSNAIPSPSQRFDNNVMRGIGLKDYYPSDNNNCDSHYEHTRLLFSYTLDRLVTTGVDTVEIYPVSRVIDFNADTWVVDENHSSIPKSELVWFIQEAHRKNLKVTLITQFYPVDTKGVWINTQNPSEAETIKFLRNWKNIIVNLANFGSTNNVENLNIYWSAFSFPVNLYPETATTEFLSLIDDVKKVYSGKLFMGWPRFYDKRIIEKVDAIVVPLGPSNWTSVEDANISVGLLKERYRDSITMVYIDFLTNSGLDPKNVSIIWDFNIQSRDKALSQGWIEDGFCTVPNGDGAPVAYSDPRCIQKLYVTDFSVQALAIEGAFQAIKEQTYFNTYGINFSTGYWHTDVLSEGDAGFPNLSQSIRGKPAENIVKYWFTKI